MKDWIERNIKDVYPKKIALNEKIMIEYCYRMAGILHLILDSRNTQAAAV